MCSLLPIRMCRAYFIKQNFRRSTTCKQDVHGGQRTSRRIWDCWIPWAGSTSSQSMFLLFVSCNAAADSPLSQDSTECFDCIPKPTPKTFPVCTIRSTPSQPIHCIVWSKSYLMGYAIVIAALSPYCSSLTSLYLKAAFWGGRRREWRTRRC